MDLEAFKPFEKATRPSLTELNPTLCYNDISYLLGDQWARLSDWEKSRYSRLARVQKRKSTGTNRQTVTVTKSMSKTTRKSMSKPTSKPTSKPSRKRSAQEAELSSFSDSPQEDPQEDPESGEETDHSPQGPSSPHSTQQQALATSDALPPVGKNPKLKRQNAQVLKRPLSSYMLFVKDTRPQVVKEHPEAKFTDLGKLIGQKWAALPDAKKADYQQRALREKELYQQALAQT